MQANLKMEGAKSARIELKTTPAVKAMLEQAAELSGETLTTFIVQNTLPKARAVISEQNTLSVSDIAWNVLTEVMSKPASATPELRDLIRLAR
jgi:uncharacterized protein (DUF1778 family)